MSIVAPIHTTEIGGTPVRFFRAPGCVPQLPWHAVDDLYRAMRLPRDLRRRMLRETQSFPQAETASIPVHDGVVVISAHPVAQGMIQATTAKGLVGRDFEAKYIGAAMAASKAMTAGLTPIAAFQLVIEATRNTLGRT